MRRKLSGRWRGPGKWVRLQAATCMALLAGQAAPGFEAELDAARQDIAAAEAALAETAAAADRAVALSIAVRAYEDAAAALDLAETAVEAKARRKARDLRAHDQSLAPVLAALQRLGAQSPAQMALGPSAPRDTVMAGILLERLADEAAAEVTTLRTALAELVVLEETTAALAGEIDGTRAALEEARKALIDASAADQARLPDLGEDAANLTELALALSGVPEPLARAGVPDAPLPAPVPGFVLRPFDTADASGARRPGLVVGTAPGALVTAPLPARIRFAGELDSYGPVVILEPETDVILVLAGLGEILVRAGQEVAAAEGLGFIVAGHEEFDGDGTVPGFDPGPPALYMEVRVNGTPVDPGLWFAYAGKDTE